MYKFITICLHNLGMGLKIAFLSLLGCILCFSWGIASENKANGNNVKAPSSSTSQAASLASSVKQDSSKTASDLSVKLSPKAKGLRAYARLQVLIEYYFMESGLYPVSLKALERSFNTGLPTDAPKVIIGDDPVSGKPFVYQVSKDRHHYTLSVPEPDKYGADWPALETIDWGWLMLAAEGKRIERLLSDCTRSINELATACEIYAKDHNKAFPAKLESLRPQYMFRELRCPASSKPYIYTFRRGGYTIECPEPRRHGLGSIKYDSDKGLFIGGAENTGAEQADKKTTSNITNIEKKDASAAHIEKK
ncbi:MAG: hypothetical protein ACI376_05160 [Candidatus Bruticola sp.]